MVSVLVPTRGRPESALRLITSAYDTADEPPEFVFYIDEDDPSASDTVATVGSYGPVFVVGPRIVLSATWNACWEKATHDVFMHCGDDIVFRTTGWDTAVREAIDAFPDRIAFVHGDDGFQHENIGTHGFVHRRWTDVLGYLVPPLFASDYNDLWLTEVADAVGRRVYLPEVLTEHMHPVAGKGELDQTHRERLARHAAEDCDRIWRDTAELRTRDAQKLAYAIAQYGVDQL